MSNPTQEGQRKLKDRAKRNFGRGLGKWNYSRSKKDLEADLDRFFGAKTKRSQFNWEFK